MHKVIRTIMGVVLVIVVAAWLLGFGATLNDNFEGRHSDTVFENTLMIVVLIGLAVNLVLSIIDSAYQKGLKDANK